MDADSVYIHDFITKLLFLFAEILLSMLLVPMGSGHIGHDVADPFRTPSEQAACTSNRGKSREMPNQWWAGLCFLRYLKFVHEVITSIVKISGGF